ncbi:MAG: homocysteine S-methyltransferase family protein [Gammaproteobacteria bacterium]|nr:homocysteine S-methyltransferase family protein [Gammaproteobacteria bacterium]MDH3411989.1 homocysteine S-methyltransferase family protein [Gammaproteobacteria bacterium]
MATPKQKHKPGLLERLDQGAVICAEGYLFALERRGYLQAGAYVPEVVLEHPEKVAELHREFVHAGSDVVEAFTYYAHREKMKLIGRENDLERINRDALAIAKGIADESGALFAGDIANTNIFEPGDAKAAKVVRAIFEEQVRWATDAGVDFIIAETISWGEEALIALDVIRKSEKPSVVTLAVHRKPETREGWTISECCKRLQDAGADVVGINCTRGPATTLPVLKEIRDAVSVHVAGLPVPFRTTEQQPTFQSLRDTACGCLPREMPFPEALDPFTCNRYEIAEFAKAAYELGVHYLGVCCGASPHHIRAMAEALGRKPPASRYSTDMSKHAFFGSEEAIPKSYKAYAENL